MEDQQLQKIFFQEVKHQLPANISLVDEIADVLGVSADSAYRRIRGEKQLLFEEVKLLSLKYKISIDQLFSLQSDNFLFNGKITTHNDFTYENWLQNVVSIFQNIVGYTPKHHLHYLAKEIPFSYYFLIPEIAAFKSYFFMKSILYYEDWKNKIFSVNDEDFYQYKNVWEKISSLYASIPSTEIWNIENITSTINQIEYYRITGLFKSNDDALILLEKLETLLNHIQLQAESGVKLKLNEQPNFTLPTFNMYINDLVVGDNMILVELNDQPITYINHSIINFISTSDSSFNSYSKRIREIISQKSIPISVVNEKERLVFFKKLKNKIEIAKQNVK